MVSAPLSNFVVNSWYKYQNRSSYTNGNKVTGTVGIIQSKFELIGSITMDYYLCSYELMKILNGEVLPLAAEARYVQWEVARRWLSRVHTNRSSASGSSAPPVYDQPHPIGTFSCRNKQEWKHPSARSLNTTRWNNPATRRIRQFAGINTHKHALH